MLMFILYQNIFILCIIVYIHILLYYGHIPVDSNKGSDSGV